MQSTSRVIQKQYCHLQQNMLGEGWAACFCHTLSRTSDKSYAFKEFDGIQLGNGIQNPLDTVCSWTQNIGRSKESQEPLVAYGVRCILDEKWKPGGERL